MTLFERLGRHSAAARCALAAARQVRMHEVAFFPAREALCLAMRNCGLRPNGFPFQGASAHLPATRVPALPPNNPQVAAVLPAPEQQLERAAAQGRLWANVFGCMMEAGRYEASAAVCAFEGSLLNLRVPAQLCANVSSLMV